ncbi:MAG: VOC family protein [Deltaproteobacteria bacterium]|nr:VOC family protein [Nannocystaceae bacterium]
MNPPRLAHVFVFTAELERMAAFYAGAMGLTREDSSDAGFVVMRASSGADVALHQVPPHILEQIDLQSPARWRDDTALKMSFQTDDLDAQRQAILDHGGQAKQPWSWENTRFCECTDPEGNVVQIFQRTM